MLRELVKLASTLVNRSSLQGEIVNNYLATIQKIESDNPDFRANVRASNDGEARNKVKTYLIEAGKQDLLDEPIFTIELRAEAYPGIPKIE